MAVEIPMGVLGWISDADNTPLITKVNQARQLLKELGADAAKNEAVQKLFREIAAEADKAAKSYQPVINQSRTFAKEMRDLGKAVSNGLVPVTEEAKRYRDLETAMSAQLKVAGLSSREHTALSKVMNVAVQEATRLKQVQRSGAATYKTDDLKLRRCADRHPAGEAVRADYREGHAGAAQKPYGRHGTVFRHA